LSDTHHFLTVMVGGRALGEPCGLLLHPPNGLGTLAMEGTVRINGPKGWARFVIVALEAVGSSLVMLALHH
jgi:hypothetical protein